MAVLVGSPAPSAAQQTFDVRVVPSLGAGPMWADQILFIGSGNALLEGEVERGGLVATGYVEAYAPNVACDQADYCDLPMVQLGLSVSTRRGPWMFGGGFGVGLDPWPSALIGRVAVEPGPVRIQLRPELLLENDFIVLVPVLLGLRVPW